MTETQKKVKELVQKLNEGVDSLRNSKSYADYLKAMSKFPHYSCNNIILIMMQKPEAAQVAGFNTWKSLGRFVKKGEKGIQILAPCPHKKKMTVRDKDGNETEETTDVTYLTYRPAYVFDISQTEGDALPSVCKELEGQVDAKIIDAVVKASDVPIEFIDFLQGGANGCYSRDGNCIYVKRSLPDIQKFKTLIHERAHSVLHNTQEARKLSREIKEVEAESTAYCVCEHFGIDSSDYSIGYVTGWGDDDTNEIFRQSLARIQKATVEIIKGIENALA